MAKDVLSTLRNNLRFVFLFAGIIAVAACARSAPELPPDYGSVSPSAELTAKQFSAADLNMQCMDIVAERKAATVEARKLTGVIHQNRGHNQVAGYLGGLFIFPIVAARQNPDEKLRLDQIQERWDILAMLDRFKNCLPAVSARS